MSHDAEATTASSPFDDEPAGTAALPAEKLIKPRLSILHLMVWTATSAGMLAVLKMFGWTSGTFSFQDGYNIGFSMYGGVVVGGIVMWIARRCRGVRFPAEPGEWLLVEQGAAVLWVLFVSLLLESAHHSSPQAEMVLALGAAGFLIIGLTPAILFRKGRLWRCVFGALALLFATTFAFTIPGGFDGLAVFAYAAFWSMLVVIMFVGAALVIDIKHKSRRGWAHGVGVAALLIFTIFHFGLMMAELYVL
jgi:hypothetical protein